MTTCGRIAITIHVRVYRDRFDLRQIGPGNISSETSATPFSTDRLLVGRFTVAEATLRTALQDLRCGKWLVARPRVLIQPMELTDGGLSEVEERVLRELAIATGARKVVVWLGSALSDQEILSRLNAA